MKRRAPLALGLGLVLAATACGGTLDAGRDTPHGMLPVDERNPVIIANDSWSDNWSGEYALLLANSGGPPLAGIIVNSSGYWPDVKVNAAGWTKLVDAARMTGLRGVPDVTMSESTPLSRPADGLIESTVPNGSAGARMIIDVSRQMSQPVRPVVVLAGSSLTDIADAYLLDATVADRVVVVSALGSYSAPNGLMNAPNGELDAWADWIVAQRFRYVQVSAYYNQTADVTASDRARLPQTPFGTWIANKQPDIFKSPTAADQVAMLAVGQPGFASTVRRAAPDVGATFDVRQGPPLVPDPMGNVWVVTRIASSTAAMRFWVALLDPRTYGASP